LADEIWASFGEVLLQADAVMTIMAFAHPLRATIWGRALGARLASLPPEMRSSRHQSYIGLARWLLTTVRDRALDELEKKMQDDPKTDEARAASVLILELR
jgi:hypothetical protein